ncbi:tRNA pseudouridine(55) synthase TruB [Oligoflexaceae bacterium]|nr:tRNA pseudouridine(55) synthase TruB [Oligoflexaceae bacterium]
MASEHSVSGLLLLNKPKGISSRQASVRVVKKIPGKIKFGHVGTLDPSAHGVLPILLGHATKCMDYLHVNDKVYDFTVQLGSMTSTMDDEGEIVESRPVSEFSDKQVDTTLEHLTGKIEQIPPIYSAIKWNGRPLYDYARKGEADKVTLSDFKRVIEVFSIECLEIDHSRENLSFRVRCSKGTYVRVLATQIAMKLGSLGHVVDLRRVNSSGFEINETVSLEEVESSDFNWTEKIVPIAQFPFVFPSWKTSESLVKPLVQGQRVVQNKEAFQHSLVNLRPQLKVMDDKVLLLNSEGDAFGIANVTSVAPDQVRLHMNRGLK